MKILHVVDSINPEKGGVSIAVRTMAAELTRFGLYTEIVSLDPSDLKEEKLNYKINKIGPSIKPWGYAEALTPWLKSNLMQFDVVIVHGLWLYSGYAVSRVFRRFKKFNETKVSLKLPKLFFMPHGMLDPYFQLEKKRKIKAIRNWFYWQIIERNHVNNAYGLLFTCKQECNLAKKPFSPYKPKREIIIGLGVHQPPKNKPDMLASFFDICPQVINENYILFLGRIDQKKGVDILIQAYEQLVKNILFLDSEKEKNSEKININILHKKLKNIPKLVIAGPGLATDYGKKIKCMVDQNILLSHNIYFPGMLEGDCKWGAFYGAEAFILPSHQENFGIAVIEAIGCGKPVLISNQVNICQEILHAHAGIVAPDTVNGTYTLLSAWLIKSNAQRLKMAQSSYECYSKYFNIDIATQQLITAVS